MKGLLGERMLGSIVLLVSVILCMYGGAPTSRAASSPLHVTATAAKATPTVQVLPTLAQVLKAVTAGVHVVKYPQQPPTVKFERDHCEATFDDTTSPMCVYGDPHGSHSLVLYGDSHAHMWIPALDAIGQHIHWKILQLTKDGCQTLGIPLWLGPERGPYTKCSTFQSFAINHIKSLHPDMVVLSNAWKNILLYENGKPTLDRADQVWDAGLSTTIASLKRLTKSGKVAVIGDIAYPDQAGGDCLAAHGSDVRPCNTPRAHAVYETHNRLEEKVTKQAGAIYVDTIPWFCTATVCPAVIGGLSTHWDTYHVAPNYALWLSYVLGKDMGLLP